MRMYLAAATMIGAAGATGAGTTTVGDPLVRVSHGLWTFAPHFDGERAAAFLAWDEEPTAHPNNLRMMLFVRDAQDHWTSYAWTTWDIGGAVTSARTLMGDVGAFSTDGYLVGAAATSQELAAPTEMTQGMLLNDPLIEVVGGLEGDEEAEELVAWLADMGWPVAMNLSAELAVGIVHCGDDIINVQDDLLSDVARKAELSGFGSSTTAASTSCGQWCSCSTTYGGWTVVAPGTWTLTGSLTTGSSKTCYYSRPVTYTWVNTGRWWYCPSCVGTGTGTGTETGSATVLVGDPCPAGPVGGTTYNP